MVWTVNLVRQAEKSLTRLSATDKKRVALALLEMRDNPFTGDIVWLSGAHGEIRRRVGDWRIIFAINSEEQIVWIKDLSRRTTTTYKRR